MILNHCANRVEDEYFEIVVEMLKTQLKFVELRRTKNSVWLRQEDANVDLQFSRSNVLHRDKDKRGSQIAFLSETPRADLEQIAKWVSSKGLHTVLGQWSDQEHYLDIPQAFVDFVIEAMTPDMAKYELDGELLPKNKGTRSPS